MDMRREVIRVSLVRITKRNQDSYDEEARKSLVVETVRQMPA